MIPHHPDLNKTIDNIPKDCITNLDKVEFWHIADEKLRLEHNAVGARFRAGELTRAQWRAYVRDEFEPRSKKIHLKLNKARAGMVKLDEQGEQRWAYDKAAFAKSERWSPDLSVLGTAGRVLEIDDPTEDFTAYTEVDPSSHISKTSATITFSGVTKDEEAYVYYDHGANHFDGDFEHLIDVAITGASSATSSAVFCWSLQNVVDEMWTLGQNSGDILCAFLYYTSSEYRIYLREVDGGDITQDYYVCSVSTVYYMKIKRDEDVGTYGTLYCYIYDDSDRTNLVDTLSVELNTSKKDFRYGFALNTTDSGDGSTMSGTVSNLDLQEQGETYEEFLTQTITISQSKSDLQNYVDDSSGTIKIAQSKADSQDYVDDASESLVISQAKTDLQDYIHHGSQSIDIAQSITDIQTYLQDDQSQTIIIVQSESDNVKYKEDRSQTVIVVQGEDDSQDYADDISQAIVIGQSKADIQTYNPENLSQTITITVTRADKQSFIDDVSQSILIVGSNAETQNYVDNASQAVLIGQSETDIQTYNPENQSETIVMALSESDIQHYFDSATSTITMALSESDAQSYIDNISETILIIPSKTELMHFVDNGLATLLFIASKADIQHYVDDASQTILIDLNNTDLIPHLIKGYAVFGNRELAAFIAERSFTAAFGNRDLEARTGTGG